MPTNFYVSFLIFCRYATEVDVDFVRKSVRAIGRCAIKVEVKISLDIYYYLFGPLENIREFNVLDMDSISLYDLLLFGKPYLDVNINRIIVEEAIHLSKIRNDCRLITIS